MGESNWQQVEELLHRALELEVDQRAAFLDVACGSDQALRAEVESLLSVGDEMSVDYLKSPLSGELKQRIRRLTPGSAMSAGQIFAERFRLVRKLGEGGMGQVWLATQLAPVRRQVAVKLIKAGMYDEAVAQRFESERQSLAMMDHPAIAKVFDAGTTPQGQSYLVMEYVPGVPITDYCDLHKLSIRKRLELFIQVCEGVQHAHQKAIVHRDLKPSNILVLEVDGKAVPRIIDFGLAKTTLPMAAGENEFTLVGQFIGTPGYMSPEQANPDARDIDTRTDVYSLGVVLYVLLTGVQPFETKHGAKPSLEEWLRQLREEEPPNPSTKVGGDKETSSAAAEARQTGPKQLKNELRGDVDWITMKALERDRARRYGTPSELAADLRRCLNDEAVTARPASAAYQLGKFVRRHRVGAVIASLAAVLLVAVGAAGLVAIRKQHEAEFQTGQALRAQSRLLTQAAGERLRNFDVAGAQGIILEVLMNAAFVQSRAPASISVFQDIRAADAQLAVLAGHREAVVYAAYSPDASRVVTGSYDRTARIWDSRTGEQLAVLTGHTNYLNFATYSPDGNTILTASDDGTARLWSARTGEQIAVLAGDGGRVFSAAYSPDGTRIVTASADKTARIWDAGLHVQVAVLTGHSGGVYCAAFSPDGTHIVTASNDKTARVWDARTHVQLALLAGHGDFVRCASYSPDGTRIVTASGDGTARIWNSQTGAQLAVLSGHGDRVYSAEYSPDGSHILTASIDKTVRVWDAATGAQVAVLSGPRNNIYSALYSADGTHIVTAHADGTARIWNARAPAQLALLSGHRREVFSADYSPDSARIVTASEDGTARIWDANTYVQLTVLEGHGDSVRSAAYSPDGAQIITASFDKTARLWDAHTGEQLAVFSGHRDRVLSAAFSPDGTRIVSASNDKTARIWDAHSGIQLVLLSGHDAAVYSAAYSPDGLRIVTASEDKTARIWDAHTGAQLAVLSGHGDSVWSAAYSPDGGSIVTASGDKTARIWDVHTNLASAVLIGHAAAVEFAAYSRDGKYIVTASDDKTARIWDVRTHSQLAVLTGHQATVESAAFSPDGTQIVSTSDDLTVRIWNARVQANLDAQILWDSSAQLDPLPEGDRTLLGLPPDRQVRSWLSERSACDQAAAADYDPDRLSPGVSKESIATDIAVSACAAENGKPEHQARTDYQMGRALLAKSDVSGAKRMLEAAVKSGYRSARIDLADLMLKESSKTLDVSGAEALYEKAWKDGVSIAAFRLGNLYENGVRVREPGKVWSWYQKGANAREPNALVRFAERDEQDARTEADSSRRNALLLRAFTGYAAAAERAREEDWPDDAWKLWRYRRATLARVLGGEGMMQQVADAYAKVLGQRPAERTLWEQIKNKMHL